MITDPQQPRPTFAYSCYYCEKDGLPPEQVFHTNDRTLYEKHGVLNHLYKPLYPNETELKKYGLNPQDKAWEKCVITKKEAEEKLARWASNE